MSDKVLPGTVQTESPFVQPNASADLSREQTIGTMLTWASADVLADLEHTARGQQSAETCGYGGQSASRATSPATSSFMSAFRWTEGSRARSPAHLNLSESASQPESVSLPSLRPTGYGLGLRARTGRPTRTRADDSSRGRKRVTPRAPRRASSLPTPGALSTLLCAILSTLPRAPPPPHRGVLASTNLHCSLRPLSNSSIMRGG